MRAEVPNAGSSHAAPEPDSCARRHAAPSARGSVRARREAAHLSGTVHAVHAGSVDLVTGVGYALRLVHLRMQPTTHISGEGGPIAPGDVRPGDVMRADCRLTADGI